MELPLGDHMEEDALEVLRDRVKKLYGNRHRLEIAVAIARSGETFYNHEIGAATGIADATARNVILDLVDAGVLAHLSGRRGLPKFYERRASSYWSSCEEVLNELIAADASQAQPRT